MITIPTGDFVGILSDVIPFAPTGKGSAWRAVRVWWDGEQMHAEALSGVHWGRSTWDQDDDPVEEYQQDLIRKWGGDDRPWSVAVDIDDAKELVKIYRLSGKGVYYVPLTVEPLGDGLRVLRAKDTGHSAITTVAAGVPGTWPKVADVLHLDQVDGVPMTELMVNAGRLADFGTVRQRDTMRLKFTGDKGPIHVRIGERFVGAVMPHREPERIAKAPAPVVQVEGQHELDI